MLSSAVAADGSGVACVLGKRPNKKGNPYKHQLAAIVVLKAPSFGLWSCSCLVDGGDGFTCLLVARWMKHLHWRPGSGHHLSLIRSEALG